MTAQPHNMRGRGLKTYFIPKAQYKREKLQDATTILKWQARAIVAERKNEGLEIEKTALKNELKRMIG